MPREIATDEVRRLLKGGAQVVEVLPREEYEEGHLPGAIHIPLTELTAESAQRLRRDRPVIVYCWDTQCDQSPRAASRLESLGFEQVFDYVAGKANWAGEGLPLEGTASSLRRIGDLARANVPTCGLTDRVGDVRPRLTGKEWDSCIVVNEQRVVLGRVYESKLGQDDGASIEAVMDPGPTTYRPDTTAHEMVHTLHEHDLETAVVTTARGVLVGLLLREDAERALDGAPSPREAGAS
jgi:rhodanese-related sulfurtransferase